MAVQLKTEIPGLTARHGKVRDIFDLGDRLILVASDRISAFDVVMPTGIPHKGAVLTQISEFWFGWLGEAVKHHFIEVVQDRAPDGLDGHVDKLRGRATVCRKAEPLTIECVVRGYLTGSGWKDYLKTGSTSGVTLPEGLKQCGKLPEPIFTPATKAETGHDENISFERACELAGEDRATYVRDKSIEIYLKASDYARGRGLIVADTKFEWGVCDGDLILIDEVLTPDSSRFWPADQYEPGHDQASFDKQYVRNYLETLDWDKTPPGPELPAEVVENTSKKYLEAYERLTGKPLV